MKRKTYFIAIAVCLCSSFTRGNDWPSWRGPQQSGMTQENATVTSWPEDGSQVLWQVPIGGRSTPIVMDGRVFMIAPAGSDETLHERIVCLDADTGKTLWEHHFNVFHTDIVENRLGWTSVVGDPETGNIYAHGTGGQLFCLSRDGKVLWQHSLTETFGRSSGYGGRLQTPIIDEDRVIISFTYILTQWGTGKKKAGHRYYAFDKRTGDVIWWAQPGGRPLNTTYSTPVITVVDGKRMLIAGNADGNVYGMLARTGEKVWTFKLSGGGLNSSAVADGKYVYISHSEENLTGNVMGRVVCIDASGKGDITETGEVWRADGLKVGYASPALANGRLYVMTNFAQMHCLDAMTGKSYWSESMGRVAKGSPLVTADGYIYYGEVNARFHILKDAGDHCEVLSTKRFTRDDKIVIEINGTPAMANGRVYFMNNDATYCLGAKHVKPSFLPIPTMAAEAPANAGKPNHLQIVPAEATLYPGDTLKLTAQLFDDHGIMIASPDVAWEVAGPRGTIKGDGTFNADAANTFSAGVATATYGELKAKARLRVSPRLPIEENFDGMKVGKQPPGWIGVDAKTKLVEKDGSIVFQKMALRPSAKYMRMRAFATPPIPVGYTVEVDMRGELKPGRRPTLPDMGIINVRYKMIMLGRDKKLRLVTYSPIPRVQKDIDFVMEPDVWYRGKLRVDIRSGSKAIVRGKVWPKGSAEPNQWTIEMTDPLPNMEGSPGLYAYSKGATVRRPGAPVFFDNFRVTNND